MLRLAKIVLPVDFSQRSIGAAHYARALVERFGSNVKAVSVVTRLDYSFGGPEGGVYGLDEIHQQQLAFAKRDLESFVRAELDGHAESVVLEGDPAQRIVEYAHSEKADLILLPTHGYGPFRRFILGSVTAKVLHDADCPIWTGVHIADAPPQEAIRFRQVLCAVDLGPHSREVLCWAAQMAGAYGARLTLLHVIPELDAGQARYFDADWSVMLANNAKERMQTLQESLGTRAENVVKSGDTAKTVREVAERISADLVVIGRGGAAGLLGRLRANAYSIIRESHCPVVSL